MKPILAAFALSLAANAFIASPAIADDDDDDHGRRHHQRSLASYEWDQYPIVLFSQKDFEGRAIGIDGPVNLRDIGFDNKAESIGINYGSWIVCKKRNLRGKCDVIDRSVYDLDDADLEDSISSIAPYHGGRNYSRDGW